MSLKLNFLCFKGHTPSKKVKRHFTEYTNICENHISAKEPVLDYTKNSFLQIKNKKIKITSLNGQRLWMDIDLKEKIHKWWISTWKDVPQSSTIRETQIKTMRHHLASTRMTRIKKTGCFGHKAENWNPHMLLVGIFNGAAAWKAVCQFLKRLDIELPYDQAIPLLGIYPCVYT